MLYAVNEKVLCFHGPLIYQAKILKAEKWTGEENSGGAVGPHYFVHYQGWKQTWDEWVSESRLLKFNDDNLAKQKALVDARKAAAQAAKDAALAASSSGSKGGEASASSSSGPRKSGGGSSSSATAAAAASSAAAAREASEEAGGSTSRRKEARGTKRARETVEQEDEYIKRPEIKIQMPDKLKVQLVDDWENVTRLEKLVPLPRRPSVVMILDQYREWYMSHMGAKKGAKGHPPAVLEEVLAGLKLYFDKALSHNLLYRFERAQLVEIRKEWAKGLLVDDSKGGVVSSKAQGQGSGGEGATGKEGEEKKGEEKKGEEKKGEEKDEGTTTTTSSRRGAATSRSTSSSGAGAKKDGEKTQGAGGDATAAAKESEEKEELEPSRIYGAEHLLRLFVNLPAIIAHTTMDAESIQVLREHLAEFLNFLVKEQKRLFVTSYQDASPAYHRLTQI